MICAKLSVPQEIGIRGGGEQPRSFTCIADHLKGTQLLMPGDYLAAVNAGRDERVASRPSNVT